MTAVITGGTSFLGCALIAELLARGEACYAIVRPESANLSKLPAGAPNLHILPCALQDTGAWMRAVPECDAFYHLAWGGVGAAGRADPEIQRANVEMAEACLKAASGLGARRFLFSGSQAEYGPCDDLLTEDHPCRPDIEYGKAKLAFLQRAAEMCGGLDLEYVHLRIFSLYGPGDHPWTLVSRCVESFLRDERMPLSSCGQMWNFLHVRDAARAICDLARAELSGQRVFNIAGAESRVLREYVDRIWTLCGRRGVPAYGEYRNSLEKPRDIRPVIDRLTAATGWREQVGFDEGIREIIDSCGG